MKKEKGLTLVELVVVLAITSILVATAVMTIAGTLPKYRLSRGSRMLYNAILSAKSKAVSLNRNYRLNVINEKTFKVEYDDEGTWTIDGSVQTLPSDIEIITSPTDYVANAAQNLIFTSRGMFDVLNGAENDPIVALKNTKTSDEKSITVNIGGNIRINN